MGNSGGSCRVGADGIKDPHWEDGYDDDMDAQQGEGPTVAELRRERDRAQRAVRRLQDQEADIPTALLEAARSQAKEADERWRAAKPPHPVDKRIEWAEIKLNKAVKLQNKHKAELEEFENYVEEQRKKFKRRAEEDRERTAKHQAALDDLRAEGGSVSDHIPKVVVGLANAARLVASGMDCELFPRLQTIAEGLRDGTKEKEDLLLTINTMLSMQVMLQGGHVDDDGAETYDIGDGDEGDDVAEGDLGSLNGMDDNDDHGLHDGDGLGKTKWARRDGVGKTQPGGDGQAVTGVGVQLNATPPNPAAQPQALHQLEGTPQALVPPHPQQQPAQRAAAAATAAQAAAGGEPQVQADGRVAVGLALEQKVQHAQSLNPNDLDAAMRLQAFQENVAAVQLRAQEVAYDARLVGVECEPADLLRFESVERIEQWARDNGVL
jgi:hypothetical protein